MLLLSPSYRQETWNLKFPRKRLWNVIELQSESKSPASEFVSLTSVLFWWWDSLPRAPGPASASRPTVWTAGCGPSLLQSHCSDDSARLGPSVGVEGPAVRGLTQAEGTSPSTASLAWGQELWSGFTGLLWWFQMHIYSCWRFLKKVQKRNLRTALRWLITTWSDVF